MLTPYDELPRRFFFYFSHFAFRHRRFSEYYAFRRERERYAREQRAEDAGAECEQQMLQRSGSSKKIARLRVR
jgi:hypothetical protein